MASASLPLIDVDRLQLGMYVVLDIGWRNHPFLRGSFTIRSAEQLDELRSLGLAQVRYDPERSAVEPAPVAAAPAPPMPTAAPAPVAEAAVASTTTPWIDKSAPWADGEPVTEQEWQASLLRQVEDEYQQLAQSHQQIIRQLQTAPAEARRAAEQLGETMYRAVANSHEPAVRLLSQRVGEQSSGHEVGVAALALLLARDCGFSHEGLRNVVLAGLLHDAGKTRLPAALQQDHAGLGEAERRAYRQHVEFGVALAESLGLARPVVRAIAEHHEHHDGSGFPAALADEQITAPGRVLAIVNRYQNLIWPPQGEVGLTPHQALQQMYHAERAHFDPAMLARFVRVMGVYPPGTLVELTDRRLAVVIASRPGATLSPRVQVLESPDEDGAAAAIEIDNAEGELRVRRSVPPAQLDARWAERSRQLARSALYIEPQSAPEWSAWGASESLPTLVY
jgi:putative nucleotidyltransferase with HDIG domain